MHAHFCVHSLLFPSRGCCRFGLAAKCWRRLRMTVPLSIQFQTCTCFNFCFPDGNGPWYHSEARGIFLPSGPVEAFGISWSYREADGASFPFVATLLGSV